MHLYEPRHAVLRIRWHGRPLLCEHQRLYLLRECLSPGRLRITNKSIKQAHVQQSAFSSGMLSSRYGAHMLMWDTGVQDSRLDGREERTLPEKISYSSMP